MYKNKKNERAARFVARNLTLPECREVCRELDVTRVAFDTIAQEHANDVETRKYEWILKGIEKSTNPLKDIKKALKECSKIRLLQQLEEYLDDTPCEDTDTAMSVEEVQVKQNNISAEPGQISTDVNSADHSLTIPVQPGSATLTSLNRDSKSKWCSLSTWCVISGALSMFFALIALFVFRVGYGCPLQNKGQLVVLYIVTALYWLFFILAVIFMLLWVRIIKCWQSNEHTRQSKGRQSTDKSIKGKQSTDKSNKVTVVTCLVALALAIVISSVMITQDCFDSLKINHSSLSTSQPTLSSMGFNQTAEY